MQRHAGKQGTCRCIPRSCIFRMLVIVNYELHHTKNRSKLDIARWWSCPIQISNPIWTGILPYKHQSSTKLVLTNSALCWFKQVQKMWVLFCSFCGTFYVHISDSCPPTFTEFCSVMEDSSAKQLPVVPTKNGVFKGKCSRPKFTRNIKTLAQMKTSAHPAGPFLTQLTLVLHSLQFHWRWEAGGMFWEQKRWVDRIFHFLSQNTHHFLWHLSQCSSKHATINQKRGGVKTIGGEQLFSCVSTINRKNWLAEEVGE